MSNAHAPPFASTEKTPRTRLLLYWDFVIVALVLLNLALIAVDTLFSVDVLAAGFQSAAPAAYRWYLNNVHQNLFTIDLAFVAVFVADVLLGWGVAIVQKRHSRWYFYPFIYWYDVLGCIPVAGFRLLRILRVLSIVMRLQHLGVIDIRHWVLYRKLLVYYDILVEEVSDRVVLRVLSGVQGEVQSGGTELTRRVMREVVKPRQQQLVDVASKRIKRVVVRSYRANRAQIRRYIALQVKNGVRGNTALKNLARVPMLGSFVTHALDQAITETVHDVLDEVVNGLESRDFDELIQRITDTAISQILARDPHADASEVTQAVVEVLELIKEQVAVKQWREHLDRNPDLNADAPRVEMT
jgi:hypothetical protein